MAGVLKRAATSIFNQGGIIRAINNLGARTMPYKTSNHGAVHREAHYFVLSFTAPPAKLATIENECNRDVDIIRNKIYKAVEPDPEYECKLAEEIKPPPYRPEVIKMMEDAKKKEHKFSKKFKFNTGLEYYPFQR